MDRGYNLAVTHWHSVNYSCMLHWHTSQCTEKNLCCTACWKWLFLLLYGPEFLSSISCTIPKAVIHPNCSWISVSRLRINARCQARVPRQSTAPRMSGTAHTCDLFAAKSVLCWFISLLIALCCCCLTYPPPIRWRWRPNHCSTQGLIPQTLSSVLSCWSTPLSARALSFSTWYEKNNN